MLRTNATGSDLDAWFDTNAGTVGTVDAGLTGKIEEYPNGWYRCSITFTAIAAGRSFWIYNTDTDNSVTVADDGGYQYIWGAQVETGPVATSYIPTTTGNVQRVRDEITLGSASSLIGQTEGTFYIEVDFRTSGVEQHILSANDGTGSNWFLIFVVSGNTRMYIVSGGTNVLNTGASSLSDGVQKLAFAYANGDQEFYRNGSSIATGTASLAALGTLTDIDLGQSFNTAQANMWIRAVAVFTRRLSDTEAEALTTL